MTEVDEIRQNKLEELKKRQEQQRQQEEADARLETAVKQLLEEKAKARLSNVKLVNPEVYFKAVQAIIYLFNAGQVQGKLNEEQLKALLKKLSEKREVHIKRK